MSAGYDAIAGIVCGRRYDAYASWLGRGEQGLHGRAEGDVNGLATSRGKGRQRAVGLLSIKHLSTEKVSRGGAGALGFAARPVVIGQ